MGPSLQERKMKKLLAPLIAGLFVTGAFAQAPSAPVAAPTARTTGDATTPMGEGTKGDMKKSMPKAKHAKHMKHEKHAPMAK